MTDDTLRRVLNRLRVHRAGLALSNRLTDDHIERKVETARIETFDAILEAFDSELPHEICEECRDEGKYPICDTCGESYR